MRHSSSCPIRLSLDSRLFAEFRAQIAEVAFDAGSVAEEEARHEAKHHVVDLTVLMDAQLRAPARGRPDLEGPGAARGKPRLCDWHGDDRRRFALPQLVCE